MRVGGRGTAARIPQYVCVRSSDNNNGGIGGGGGTELLVSMGTHGPRAYALLYMHNYDTTAVGWHRQYLYTCTNKATAIKH